MRGAEVRKSGLFRMFGLGIASQRAGPPREAGST